MGDFLSDDQQLVFVGGLHRSGTTLLAACSPPTQTRLDWPRPAPPRTRASTFSRSIRPPSATADRPVRAQGQGPPHRDIASCDPCERHSTYGARGRPYWDTDKQFLVEKSPPNLVMGRFLQSLYPSAAFVFIVRHPVTVTLATRKWRKRTSLNRLMSNWFRRARPRDRRPRSPRTSAHGELRMATQPTPSRRLLRSPSFCGMPGTIDTSSVDAGGSTPLRGRVEVDARRGPPWGYQGA